jgi:uncharacterized protein YbjT (DUF2867 family)
MNSEIHAPDLILVTGAGGAVGSALVEELRMTHARLRAAYHSPPAARAAAATGLDAIAIDLSDPSTLQPALAGVRSVFLLGATGPDQTTHELRVVSAANAAGVQSVVKLSVWRAPERLTPIARLHRPVEEALERSPMQWTFLRPNFYIQNFTRGMAASIARDGVIAQPPDKRSDQLRRRPRRGPRRGPRADDRWPPRPCLRAHRTVGADARPSGRDVLAGVGTRDPLPAAQRR